MVEVIIVMPASAVYAHALVIGKSHRPGLLTPNHVRTPSFKLIVIELLCRRGVAERSLFRLSYSGLSIYLRCSSPTQPSPPAMRVMDKHKHQGETAMAFLSHTVVFRVDQKRWRNGVMCVVCDIKIMYIINDR